MAERLISWYVILIGRDSGSIPEYPTGRITEVIMQEDSDRYLGIKPMRPKRRKKVATKAETGGCGLPLARLKADRTPTIVTFREH